MNSNDIDTIKQIERLLWTELKILPFDEMIEKKKNGYALDNLKRVVGLNLEYFNIVDISYLSRLVNLSYLSLGFNKIINLTPISSLTNLEYLEIRNNQLTDLTPLKELKNLKSLDVRYNLLKSLPSLFSIWWPKLKIEWEKNFNGGLNPFGNPLNDPSIDIIKKGQKAIENYFAETKAKTVLFLESKLLIVGSGDVGKTTLVKKLKDNSFIVTPKIEDTTRGIDIQPWLINCTFPDNYSRQVLIHSWDFGGQEILYATHQFFLTKRSLYLFVWDSRSKEEETMSFDYWLNSIKLLGENSPIIVIMNKSDLRIKHINEASFKNKFPNIIKFMQVSCINGYQIPELTEVIRSTLSKMPHLLDKLPKHWVKIRDYLKSMNFNYISLDVYFKICKKYNMDKERALFLSDYLHDIGIILHFRLDPILINTVILKPEWTTGAVYALIDSLEIQKDNGQFNRSDLSRFWTSDLYPNDTHVLLLRLMERFELCFNIVNTDNYIIPELLPANCPVIDIEAYKSANNLHLHYYYEFMPAGILTRFISRTHYLINNQHYWKDGVELTFEKSQALIISDSFQKRIIISVSGEYPAQLMSIIRSHFGFIHNTLNMQIDEHISEEVPCNCTECIQSKKPHFYKYSNLNKFLNKGKDIFCEKSTEEVSVIKLLKGFFPLKKNENLFDSIITIALHLQGISKTLQQDENSRNTIVALLLSSGGYRVKDQTLWGYSASGKCIGELDIKIEDDTGRTISIIEAMNLNSLNTTELKKHIYKLLNNYNRNGADELYILIYVSVKDFGTFSLKYKRVLARIDYQEYPLLKKIETINTRFNRLVVYCATQKSNARRISLNHILIAM